MFTQLRRAAWPVGIGLAGIAVFVLLQVTKPRPAPKVDVSRPISVEVLPAIRATSRPTVVAYGEVRPAVRTQLVAQVGGRITAIAPSFIEGGAFAPGEVLLSIEDTDYLAAVEEQRARVAAAQVYLEQALADADVAVGWAEESFSVGIKKASGGAGRIGTQGSRNRFLVGQN